MKKLICLLLIIGSFICASAQIFTKPSNPYGTVSNRATFDSTVYIPTDCGVPHDTASLYSVGFGNGQKLKKGALYYDSCGHHLYAYDPTIKDWHRVDSGSGGSGGGMDTMYRKPGKDSIYYTINGGAERRIKDSTGGSSSTPTLQDVITAGNRLTSNTLIKGIGATTLNWDSLTNIDTRYKGFYRMKADGGQATFIINQTAATLTAGDGFTVETPSVGFFVHPYSFFSKPVTISDTLKLPSILVKSDSNALKPVVKDGSGNVYALDHWPTGPGGGGTSTLADSTSDGLMRAKAVRQLGSLTVDRYDINDFGGHGDGVTDNTTALNNLLLQISMFNPKRNSEIFFGDSVYIFSSPTTDTARLNAIIPFPSVLIDSQIYSIKLRGGFPPPFSPSGYYNVPQPAGTKLRVTYNQKHGTNPCFLGGRGDLSNPYHEVSYMMPELENLTIQMHDSSKLTAVDFRYFTNTRLKNVNITSGVSQSILDKPEPLDSTVYGFRQPHTLSGIMQLGDNINVMGFYNGIEAGEGAILDNINVFSCVNGLVCDSAGGVIRIGRYIGGWCRYFLVHRPSVQGTSLTIDSWNCERWDTAFLGPSASGWYNFKADMRDDATTPQSKLKGDIAFRNVAAGGPYLPWNFINVGGDSCYLHEQGNKVTNYYDVAATTSKVNKFFNRNAIYPPYGNIEFYTNPPGSELTGGAIGVATPAASIDGDFHISGYGGVFAGGTAWGDYILLSNNTGLATFARGIAANGPITNTFNSNSFVAPFSSVNTSTGSSAGQQIYLQNNLNHTVSMGLTNGSYSGAFAADQSLLQTDATNGLVLQAGNFVYNNSGIQFSVSGTGNAFVNGKFGMGVTPSIFSAEFRDDGYTVPSTSLHITQALENAANSAGLYLGHNSSNSDGALLAMAGSLEFWSNNSGTFAEKMRMTSAGLLGINTTSPDSTLTVSGGINTMRLRVSAVPSGSSTDSVATIAPDGTIRKRPVSAISSTTDSSIFSTKAYRNKGIDSVVALINALPILDGGTYTPTLTNGANISSSTAQVTHWSRGGGNQIWVDGAITVTPTLTATNSALQISLPVLSAFSSGTDLSGGAWTASVSGFTGLCEANVVNNTATLGFVSVGTGEISVSFHFMYTYVAP